MREKIKSSSDGKKRRRKSRRTFKLPVDIVASMKKEFPEIKNFDQIVNKLFEKILNKILNDGSCTVPRFGYFFAYKSFSQRTHRVVPRIKFSMSRTLSIDLLNDQYLMDKISEFKTRDSRIDMLENDKTGGRKGNDGNPRSHSLRKSKEADAQDEIASILEETFDD